MRAFSFGGEEAPMCLIERAAPATVSGTAPLGGTTTLVAKYPDWHIGTAEARPPRELRATGRNQTIVLVTNGDPVRYTYAGFPGL
ncbi:hypothetical protein JCM17961_14910 [Endothiovibrio diazotrophicus]